MRVPILAIAAVMLLYVTVTDGMAETRRPLLIRVTATPEPPSVTLLATPDFPVPPGQKKVLACRA